MPEVKICGICRHVDASLAVDLGADALGFNFYKKSPRYIEPLKAKEIIQELPKDVWRVGVFVNSSLEEVEQIAEQAKLDTLQFSGDEDVSFMVNFSERRTIKGVRFGGNVTSQQISDYARNSDHLLFDRFDAALFGGTGKEIGEAELITLSEGDFLRKAFLAGGITPDNVAEKIRRFHPFGIDIASGVEEKPGIKSAEKMKALFDAVRKEG